MVQSDNTITFESEREFRKGLRYVINSIYASKLRVVKRFQMIFVFNQFNDAQDFATAFRVHEDGMHSEPVPCVTPDEHSVFAAMEGGVGE